MRCQCGGFGEYQRTVEYEDGDFYAEYICPDCGEEFDEWIEYGGEESEGE